ncbi:MAG: hypothetical protein LBE14_01335 [Treponema sp.]|jgi:hypothetical protein|nr:hypothetical protein [Treponema sp.]
MKTTLAYFDIFPKIFHAHRTGTIRITGRGLHAAFAEGVPYELTVIPMNETNLNEPERPYKVYELLPQGGTLSFSHDFGDEGRYVLLVKPKDRKLSRPPQRMRWPAYLKPQQFYVYALDEDLFRLRPYRGDMHVHSFRSDGAESPAVTAADYRRAGFDFLAITDHEQYGPSLEAIEAFKGVPIDLCLFPGEEVHPPGDNTHYVHFAGAYSVNDIFRNEAGRYEGEIAEIAKTLELPQGIKPLKYASCLWVCGEIKKAGGMSIMVHPHWIQDNAYHVSEKMCVYMLKNAPFDAFELTSGQRQAENQMQISLWQQLRAEGCSIPVVGSSDSHSTEAPFTWFNVSKMAVLAEDCGKDGIIRAVRNKQVVVMEQYPGEALPRLYGEYRYTAFVLFLLEEYFPLHDELCFEEGRLMKEYACGGTEAAALLGALRGRCGALMGKCWDGG